MPNEKEAPSISLQTMVMAIQAIENEISEMTTLHEQSLAAPGLNSWTTDDDIWMYDLDRAAQNLEEVYTYTIDSRKIINFPKYEVLVNRKNKL